MSQVKVEDKTNEIKGHPFSTGIAFDITVASSLSIPMGTQTGCDPVKGADPYFLRTPKSSDAMAGESLVLMRHKRLVLKGLNTAMTSSRRGHHHRETRQKFGWLH